VIALKSHSPYILPELEPDAIGEHLVFASSKFCFVDKLLKKVLPEGDRVLLFSVSRWQVQKRLS
jgi:hypothetical protein